jgi:putative ABC transport system permease protein
MARAERQVPIGRRLATADRRRLVVSVIGIGAALGLILLLEGLWTGLLRQASAYEEHVGAGFGRQAETRALVEGAVPADSASLVRAVPGVDRADPVIARSVILDLEGTRAPAVVIGYVPGGLGGPWALAAGRSVSRDGEVVLDRTLADDHGIALGDRFSLLGSPLSVVGLSRETQSFMGVSYLFVSETTAARLFGVATATFILFRPDTTAVGGAISDRTGLSAMGASVVAAADRAQYTRVMARPLQLMIAIAFIAGTLIVALTAYSMMVERRREFGIVKAMGATRVGLFRMVLAQTTTLAATGGALASVLAAAAQVGLPLWRPQSSVVVEGWTVVAVLGAALLMALLAAIVPTHRLIGLDPASVYRG